MNVKSTNRATVEAGDIVLISLFGSMGDLAFLARLAQELSQNCYSVTLIFNQWYLDNSDELLRGLEINKIGLDRDSRFAYSRKDWEGRARVVVDLFRASHKPRLIVSDISAQHLFMPAKRHGIPFVVASPMPWIKTREFFLGSPYPCIGKFGWFNLLRWEWGATPGLWWRKLKNILFPPRSPISDPVLREQHRRLYAPPQSKEPCRGGPAAGVIQFVSADPIIIPRPSDWKGNVHVLGSLPWNTTRWKPSDELLEFLSKGPPPLYVGFGSLTATRFSGQAGAAFLLDLAEAARAMGIRMVFSAPFGVKHYKVSSLPANTFITQLISHEWLFPRCTAVMCHGGYGTLYDALHAKRPVVVFPGQSDEFYLAKRMTQLGVAPAAKAGYFRFTAQDFCIQLGQLMSAYELFKTNAEMVGHALKQTDGPANHLAKIMEIAGPPRNFRTG